MARLFLIMSFSSLSWMQSRDLSSSGFIMVCGSSVLGVISAGVDCCVSSVTSYVPPGEVMTYIPRSAMMVLIVAVVSSLMCGSVLPSFLKPYSASSSESAFLSSFTLFLRLAPSVGRW